MKEEKTQSLVNLFQFSTSGFFDQPQKDKDSKIVKNPLKVTDRTHTFEGWIYLALRINYNNNLSNYEFMKMPEFEKWFGKLKTSLEEYLIVELPINYEPFLKTFCEEMGRAATICKENGNNFKEMEEFKKAIENANEALGYFFKMTFSQEQELIKEFEQNKNLALKLLAEIGACKITPLSCIPLQDFEKFKKIISLQAWLKENRDEYIHLHNHSGSDAGRFSIHLIHLDKWIDEMVKSVVVFENPHTINTHNKEEVVTEQNVEEKPETKGLLLRESLWCREFNKTILSIRKKIEDKNSKFHEECYQLKENLLTYASSRGWSAFRSDVEGKLLILWCENTLIVLELAHFFPESFDQCLKCVTYNKNFQKQSGVGHASEAQYAFTMLMNLDHVQ
jgi:hypothetical protein